MELFTKETKTALQAQEAALRLAFAPIAFQATRALRDMGILQVISDSGTKGLTIEEVLEKVKVTRYAARVLMEAGLGMELLIVNNKRYSLTKTGYFILHDKLTRINMDFTQDICYRGMDHLQESLIEGKPAGLKELGPWDTIYPGLPLLPPKIGKSWYDFDHYYSDLAFPQALQIVFENKPRKLLDIGGNTGKWTLACTAHDKEVQVTMFDLPGEIEIASQRVKDAGVADRVSFHEANILDESLPFPAGFDAIWMSQFLDCFSEEQIVSILKRCGDALTETGTIYILEPFWDRQPFKSAAFCLQQTSLYFTAMANGNSQMYHTDEFFQCIDQAGLKIVDENNQMGLSYTLLQCKRK
ncbi:methyltransferase domain-containing protein [Chitinophaga oryziterrae]|uniref:Methyltransferase domain-containing protein n=1 Tax=Chitinophaga oryziterrae TaxID=1031224 RepID=A0A6N8J6R6_9BACT|nr:methyltransferase [Chitinophaga oryziterrae]MVT40900.1 methyltransferase domain-containing protein [Chitinophaga oryziterrae]